jgi:hypothetical protein
MNWLDGKIATRLVFETMDDNNFGYATVIFNDNDYITFIVYKRNYHMIEQLMLYMTGKQLPKEYVDSIGYGDRVLELTSKNREDEVNS